MRVLACAVALLISFGCGDDDGESGGRDGSAGDSEGGSGVKPRRDGGTPPMAGKDGGSGGSHADSGADSGASCDARKCPTPGAPITSFGGARHEQRPCCGENGVTGCGVYFPDAFDAESQCGAIDEGPIDDQCLDAVVEGKVVQGCRDRNGKCGHFTPGWGCHHLYRRAWDPEIDDSETTLPNPFTCVPLWTSSRADPCTRSDECCRHPTHGSVCWLDDDVDAGVTTGICEDSEEVESGSGTILRSPDR